jgi:hypothetical protein
MKSFLKKFDTKKISKLFEKNDAKKIARFISSSKYKEASRFFTQNAFSVKTQIAVEAQSAPEIGVWWHALQPDQCIFKINPTLSKERIQFITVRLMLLLPLIVAFHESDQFIAGSIFINLDDAAEMDGLAFCSNRDGQILIPDTDFLDSKGYINTRNHFDANPVVWELRKPIAFWRGNTTGIRRGDSWKTIPRIQLCEICSDPKVRDLFDVGISGLAQIPKAETQALMDSGLMRPYVPILLSNQYKYQIDVDGNSIAWAGLFQKLLSKSAVLKVASSHGFQQWYYDRLTPWEHFVPVEAEMDDLVGKTQWLIANDEKAMKIGHQGAEFAASLSYDAVMNEALQKIHHAFLENEPTYVGRAVQ